MKRIKTMCVHNIIMYSSPRMPVRMCIKSRMKMRIELKFKKLNIKSK